MDFVIKSRGGSYIRETKGFKPKVWECQEKRAHSVWRGMMSRCYKKGKSISPRYLGCTVSKSWHDFNTFKAWFLKQYKEDGWQIDKDILFEGNKVYSEETCAIVPRIVNMLFTKTNKIRGDLPIGVSRNENRFKAYINKYGEKIHLGTYDTPEEAFLVYKEYKEEYIKEIANTYKDVIRKDVYLAMIKYVVKIDD